MENLVLTQLSTTELKNIVGEALQSFFSQNQFNRCEPEDVIGGVELAEEITGLKQSTIYSLISQRRIPHFKRGKKVYFSREDLTAWLRSGERKTK